MFANPSAAEVSRRPTPGPDRRRQEAGLAVRYFTEGSGLTLATEPGRSPAVQHRRRRRSPEDRRRHVVALTEAGGKRLAEADCALVAVQRWYLGVLAPRLP
jgi:hypothetical protein